MVCSIECSKTQVKGLLMYSCNYKLALLACGLAPLKGVVAQLYASSQARRLTLHVHTVVPRVNKGGGRVSNCAYPRANTVYKVT